MRSCLLTISLFAAMILPVRGQPALWFKHIDVAWPAVSLYFSVTCDGYPAFSYHKENFRVTENGVPVDNFAITCPDTAAHCPISVTLVFDASGSMAVPFNLPNENAIAAGHIFLEDFVDGVDQASIIWFNNRVTLALGMISNKQRLNSCIDTLPAIGGTAMRDALYAGILEAQYNGSNPCKAVVLLTDGIDNLSTRTLGDVIDLAIAAKMKVFTIGLGRGLDSTSLKLIADTTGGRYYRTEDPVELRKIYRTIAKMISLGEVECALTYTGTCIDGGDRTVMLTLQNFCGGSDSSALTFHAPDNTGRTMRLHVASNDTTIAGGRTFDIRQRLVESLDNDLFHPFETVVRFDTSLLALRQVVMQPGDLLYGIGATIRPLADGAAVIVTDSLRVTGTGRLFSFRFEPVNPVDTVCTEVAVEHWSFNAGCMSVSAEKRRVCIIPCHLDPRIALPNNGVLCIGDSIELDAGPGYALYEWHRNGVPLSGAERTITVRDTGRYTVRVTTAEWCSALSPEACVTSYPYIARTIGSTSTFYLGFDHELVVPVAIAPPVDPGTPLNWSIAVRFDPAVMEFAGVASPDAAAWTDPLATTGGAGTLQVTSQGVVRDTLGRLFGLRFRSARGNTAAVTRSIDISQSSVESRCAGEMRFLSPTIIAEGICDRIMERRSAKPTLAAHPNPAAAVTNAVIGMPAEGYATLRLCNASGRSVRHVLGGTLSAGETTVRMDMTGLETGTYFLQLLTDRGAVTCPLVFVR